VHFAAHQHYPKASTCQAAANTLHSLVVTKTIGYSKIDGAGFAHVANVQFFSTD